MKTTLLVLVFGLMGMSALAQTSLIPSPFATSITNTSARVSVDLYANTGQQVQVVCYYKTANLSHSDTLTATGEGYGVALTVPFTLDSLIDSTTYHYEFGALIADSLVDSTSTGYTFMTLPNPAQPAQVVFNAPTSVGYPYTATVYVSGNAHGTLTKISAEGNKVGQTSFLAFSNSKLVTGIFSDSLTISGLQPNAQYFFRLKSVPQNDSLIPVYATTTLYYVTTDSAGIPTVTELSTDSSQTAVYASAHVTLGNVGLNYWKFQLLDSTGANLISQTALRTITTNGPISDSATGRLPYTLFVVRFIVMDSIGSDTTQSSVRTLQVSNPSDSFLNFTSTQTAATLNIHANSDGTFAGSKIVKWTLLDEYDDPIDSNNLAITGSANFQIGIQGLSPASSSTFSVAVRNAAGLTATTNQFLVTTKPLIEDGEPTFAVFSATDPSTFTFIGINDSITPGDTSELYAYVKDNNIGSIDSMLVTGGLTANTTEPDFVFGNLVGGHWMTGWLGNKSKNGIMVYGPSLSNLGISAINPVLADIVEDSVSYTDLTTTIIGNDGGTVADLTFQLSYNNNPIDVPIVINNVGTGSVDYSYTFYGLSQGSTYSEWAQLEGVNGDNPVSVQRVFKTLGVATGITNIPKTPLDQLVVAWDILGRRLIKPEDNKQYFNALQDLKGKGAVIVAPIDRRGHIMGDPFKIMVGG